MLKFTKDFNSLNRKVNAFCFILLFLFVILLPTWPYSQNEERSVVTKISVTVNGQPSSEEMKEIVPIKEGEPFSLMKVSHSIKQMYKTGLFSDIQVIREGEQEIQLIFLLTKRPFTRRIDFRDELEISHKKLREKLSSLRRGSSYSAEKLSKAEEELKELLIEEGYFQPEIKVHTEKNVKTSTVDVFFEIRSSKRFIISKIFFTGDVYLPEAELREKMKSKEGEAYIPSLFEEDITRLKEFYRSMDYQRAKIEIEEESFDEKTGQVFLTLKFIPQEKIEIIVRGADVPLDPLKSIWEARIFEEWGLAEGEAKIISHMRKKGYIFASVRSSIEKIDNEIRVIYEVTPGEKYKIQTISFKGLQYFAPSQLKQELRIQEGILFLGGIDGARLFELPYEIEILYKSRGFSETKADLNFLSDGRKISAIYYITEGNQERIEKISFEGVESFDHQTLLEQLSSFQGGPFFQPNIQRDIEKLENYYLNQGVRGTEIRAEVAQTGENAFSVAFNISEGEKVKIDKIVVTGNVITKKSTIRREFRIKEGDYAFYESIRETKRRLERLGIFTEVKIEEILVSPQKENLVISVKEGRRNFAGIGLGLETKNEPRTFAIWDNEIRPRGTAEFIRSNVLGTASQLSLVGQASLKEKRAVISWEQPYFFSFQMPTYLNVWIEREERKSFSFDRRGISLTTMKPVTEYLTFLATLRYARTTLIDLLIAESEVDRQYFPFSTSSILGSFIWDKRDEPFNPQKGLFLSFVAEWAYPLFKAESDFLKTFVKYQHYIPLLSRFTLSLTSRLGLGRGRMPISERFFAGGSNSFRGAAFDELGPRDPDSLKPVGGKALFLFNIEFTFPLSSLMRNLVGAIFYDAGNVFAKRRQFSPLTFQDALGLGLRYRTPLGPLRFDVGWNTDPPKGERKVLAFITIGNVF